MTVSQTEPFPEAAASARQTIVALEATLTPALPFDVRAVVDTALTAYGTSGAKGWRASGFVLDAQCHRNRNLPEAVDRLDRSAHGLEIPGDRADHLLL